MVHNNNTVTVHMYAYNYKLNFFAVGKVVPAPGSQSALTDHTEQGESPTYDETQTTGFHSNEVVSDITTAQHYGASMSKPHPSHGYQT